MARVAGILRQLVSMDIRQVRYFVFALEGSSLSAAAKRQFVTVQAVSKAISELESELGARLLVRGNHGVKPTAIGEGFYDHARKALAAFDELDDFTRCFPTSKSNDTMLIALCSPDFANAEAFLANLEKFTSAHLGIKVSIIVTHGKEAIEALRAGEVDVVCTIGEYVSPDTDMFKIGSLPTGIALAKSHPLAHQKTITLEDMRPYPMIWSESYDEFNRSIHVMYRERGLKSPRALFTPETTDVDEFFTEKNGLSFAAYLPFSQIIQSWMTLVPIDPKQAIKVPLCLITLKSHKTDAYLKFERSAGVMFRGNFLK